MLPGMEPSGNAQFLSTPSEKTEYIHNFMNTLKISNYYNDSIESKKLEWLLEVECAGELVKWFCSYIGPENVLQEEEINEYLELTAAGIPDTSVLNPSQLNDVASSSVKETYESTLNPSQFKNDVASSSVEVTYQSVASIEEEILELDTFIAVISDLDGTLRPKCKSVQDDLHQQRERSKSVQRQVQKTEHACNTASKELDLTRARFMECFLSLNSILNYSHTDQREHLELLSHMPIKDLMTKYDQSAQHIDFIMSRNHHEEEMSSGINELSAQFISSKNKTKLRKTLQKLTFLKEIIIKAKNKFVLAYLEKQENLAALAHITTLTNDIQTGLFQPSRNKLRIQLANFEDKLEDFRQTLNGSHLINAIEQFMNANVTQIFHKLSEKAERHQNNSFECRQMLLNCVEARVYHCHLFLVLLVDEKQKLNDIAQLLQEYAEPLTEEFQQLTERIEKMKMIRGGKVHNPRDGKELCESSSLKKMLLSLAPTQSLHKDKHLLDAFKILDERIRLDEQVLLHTSFQAMEDILTKNLQALQELVKLLFSGTTKKPMIVDLDLSCQLYDIDLLVTRLKERLQDIIAVCEVAKTNYLSNKYFRDRRLLWVYFLTEYEKIDGLIANMEHALSEQEKQHA